MSDMQDRIDEFHRLGAEAFGISVDSHHAAGVWAAAEGFSFPLLSDFKREAMTAYGVKRDEDDPYSVSRRALFVIDRSGKIVFADVPEGRGLPDADAALAKVREIAEKQG